MTKIALFNSFKNKHLVSVTINYDYSDSFALMTLVICHYLSEGIDLTT